MANREARRPIRSFVRRAGRMTASQQRALDELWPLYGVEYAPQQLDLAQLFGRVAPCVLEIGFGNGDSLVQLAQEQPAANFLGIEVHDPGIGHCMLAASAAAVSNLRLIAHDAIEVLQVQIPPAALARINLYFPDPWPKKRHHKRRIVQPDFIALCASRLQPGGALYIATDWADYAEHIDATMRQSVALTCVERREHDGSRPLCRPGTKFERRGERLGHRIWDWHFEKIDL
jgi:tRNA (guanine-N7-)-methyltransferase